MEIGALTGEEVEALLTAEALGRIGCHADGRTYVVPVTFAYAEGSVFAHSFEGQKIRMMRRNPSVCFEVERVADMANWESVIAWGQFEELRGEAALDAMDRLVQRFGPPPSATGAVPHAALAAGEREKAVILFRIRLTEKTGRYARA